VIFDCDGVLVDSEPISNRVLARLLSEQGLTLTTEQSRARYQGRLLADIVADAGERLGRALPVDFAETYERERDEAFRAELAPVADAREAVLAVIAAGIRVCVASQGRRAKSELTLTLTGLRELFGASDVFSAEQVERGKPHPDLFLHAAVTMGAEPARCAVVEDTPSGIAAAHAAGMRALGLAADGDERALRDAGAEIVHSMAEVPALLGLANAATRAG
jgi:HAD superfamily hydrolase (TIGR01509 family)